jgi:hypothetical protein
MRAEHHAVLRREHDGRAHRVVIAGVAAARNIRTIDERPDLVLTRGAFAKVGAQVADEQADDQQNRWRSSPGACW